MKSSSALSAQWRSSKTRTVGPVSASRSKNIRSGREQVLLVAGGPASSPSRCARRGSTKRRSSGSGMYSSSAPGASRGRRRLLVLDDPRARGPSRPVPRTRRRRRRRGSARCHQTSRPAVDVLLEFPAQAGLADPADVRPSRRGVGGGRPRSRGRAPYEAKLRSRPANGGSTAGVRRSADEADDPHRLPELDRLGLALERMAARVFENDGRLPSSASSPPRRGRFRARLRTGSVTRC